MGSNRGDVGRYLYWSDRAIRQIAEENNIELAGRRAGTIGLNWKIFTATVSTRERTTRRRLQEARRLELHLGAAIDQDLVAPRAMFVRGVGEVSFSTYQGWSSPQKFVMMHVELASATGQRVDLCLFGSMDNLRGRLQDTDNFETGWTSSAAPAVDELLVTRGRENYYYDNDEQARSYDALNMALRQGMSPNEEEGRPETRGMTLGLGGDCEFVAEVYTDVVLDRSRWLDRDDDPTSRAERIIIGRPLWLRQQAPSTLVSYADLRNGPAWQRQRLLRRLHLIRRRPLHPVGRSRPSPTAALFTPEVAAVETDDIRPPTDRTSPVPLDSNVTDAN